MQQIVLTRRPKGVPHTEDFRLVDVLEPLREPGQLLLETKWISLDPYLRGVISGNHLGQGLPLVARIPASIVGRVLASDNPSYSIGDMVVTEAGWSARCVVNVEAVRKLDPDIAPVQTALGVLGMPGLTAWAGVNMAEITAGDVVLVSAAAGAVGGSVGQWAKHRGAKAIGIAGGPKKCALVREVYGFDACVDYKAGDFAAQLKAACPSGIDVYFDNVGGAVLDEALNHLRPNARIVLCGLIDQYNKQERPPGPNLGRVIAARAAMRGLVVYDHFSRLSEFLAEAEPLVASGTLRIVEDISDDLPSAPAAFCRLMRGNNVGKALVQL